MQHTISLFPAPGKAGFLGAEEGGSRCRTPRSPVSVSYPCERLFWAGVKEENR
ncbi:hypothetical protein [uncultured Bacteroides sp.]|uniref:hypothetical protein n=1 Tax=uncultured Bacteroides sp. TaxID=162156 RepID=UPI0025952696|nr:hypothetical protein [uncultured Bacteroides sp.]